MSDYYINGFATEGSWFNFMGLSYGKGTKVRMTEEFYDRMNLHGALNKGSEIKIFYSITVENGHRIWRFGPWWCVNEQYIDIDPVRDIKCIVTPVWRVKPKDLVKFRLRNGTWTNYIWKETLFYAICLFVSPIFQQWYLIWTIGLFIYLGVAYEKLSKGELNRGW